MALIVQKYGGTSVGDPARIKNVASRVLETQRAGHKVVVVVSAMGHTTDELTGLAAALNPNPPPRPGGRRAAALRVAHPAGGLDDARGRREC